MPAHPLTHHEIFTLVAPFTRRGHHVDLAGSQRLERRLRFKPEDRPEGYDLGPLRHVLELDCGATSTYSLVRRTMRPDGSTSTLEAQGEDPAGLLAAIEAIAPAQQFEQGNGFAVAYDYRVEPRATTGCNGAGASGVTRILTRAVATVAGLTLTLLAPTVKGEPATFTLRSATPLLVPLPHDLLAVLGRNWSPMRWSDEAWCGRLRSSGREPMRSRHTELEFMRAARHLAVTLGEAPALFHRRWRAARWAVYGRCAVPLLACIGVIAAAAAVPRAHIAEHSALRMLIFNAPPLMMVLVFCLREIPRVELPTLPRRASAPAWAP